jgi:hypothetical protein
MSEAGKSSAALLQEGTSTDCRERADEKAAVEALQQVWAVTGFDDAVRLTAGLGPSALERLLDHERENSDRPRYRRMLRRRLDDAVALDDA